MANSFKLLFQCNCGFDEQTSYFSFISFVNATLKHLEVSKCDYCGNYTRL